MKGRAEIFLRGEWHTVRAGHAIAVLLPEERMRVRWGADSEILTLLSDTQMLHAALKALAPHADDRPLRFHTPVLGFPGGVAVYGAARLLADVFSQYQSANEVAPRITRQLADQALNAVLLGLEHNHSDEIRRGARSNRTASVDTAIELIEAETCATHSIPELARHCGVTARALELSFRKALDVTPHAFLQQTRLEKAHRELQAADACDGVTVAQIAARWGFWHLGRFAARYRTRYGMTPSEALRSSPQCARW